MGRINTNINEATQVSKMVTINDSTSVMLVDENPRRISVSFHLPENLLIMNAVISETEAKADALTGEPIGQNFSGNTNRIIADVSFGTNKAAQCEKWALVDSTAASALTTFDLFVIEYIA